MTKFTLSCFILLLSCDAFQKRSVEFLADESVQIGTQYFRWIDADRVDPYYGGHRLINVQIWYPISPLSSNDKYQKAQYYYELGEVAKNNNWSKEETEFASSIRTQSFVDVPIIANDRRYPLILFSPSLGGNISFYTRYAENLVELGFIVVGINHLYESEYVINNENEYYNANLRFHDSLKLLDIPAQITAEHYRSIKGYRQKVLGEDLVFCLNKLNELNETTFDKKMDLTKVGAFGHSIGGAASIYASILDTRFKAVLDIDGTPPSIALERGINVPFMFIEDLTDFENHTGYKKLHKRRNDFCSKIKAEAYRILIAETSHNSFLDWGYHIAESQDEQDKAMRIIETTSTYISGFFGRYLKDEMFPIAGSKTDSLIILKF